LKSNTDNGWAELVPYNRYFDFIAPDADRYGILIEQIKALNLHSAVIPVAGNNHIFIFPPGQKSLRSPKSVFPFSGTAPFLLAAHYDRVAGSPGANDNSIAVFHLLSAAVTLIEQGIDHWIIVFTDKEELKPGESFEAQGSYTLAKKLKTWGLEKVRIFNFDTCGSGSVFIFSTTTDHILKDSESPGIYKVRNEIGRLRAYALQTANNLRLNNVLLAPTPFSDDIGFLRAGLAAQTVTMLPNEEAKQYESLLRARTDFADLIISGKIEAPEERRCLPETWRILNSASDTHFRLTPSFFPQTVQFITELCKDRKTAAG
jgi:hypothetical protein